MASPGFNNPVFQQGSSAAGSYQTSTVPPQAPSFVSPAQDAQLEGAYAAPSADARDTQRMSIEDTIWKAAGLFAIMIVVAAVSWVWTRGGAVSVGEVQSITLVPTIIGSLGGLVLGLVNSFKKSPSVPLIVAYAGFQGLLVGGISSYFELAYNGIVTQAVLATLAVVGVTLALFASGKIRASKKATKILLIAMIGYLVFSLLNLGLVAFGVLEGWGMRDGVVGVVIGILVVIMAAYSLVLDFDMIQNGVRNGAPRKFGWMAAFGLMATVVWLYVEVLRLLAILRGSD